MNNATTDEDLERARRYWLADNPGILTRIARELGLSQPYVGDIFYYRRSANTDAGAAVKQRLAETGAPGFEGKQVTNEK